jgi:hypothetical protein
MDALGIDGAEYKRLDAANKIRMLVNAKLGAAIMLVRGWHVKRGGYESLAHEIRALHMGEK